VDKAVRITGIIPTDDGSYTMVNLDLKPGWNKMIAGHYTVEAPLDDSNFKWQIGYK
jgi:hypothetical protein